MIGNKWMSLDMAQNTGRASGTQHKKEYILIETYRNTIFGEFKCRANFEGYWTYQPMLLQLEYCVDGLKVLNPYWKFLLIFDHSCVHDQQKENGLNVERMTKLYGGARKRRRSTVIKQTQGYLGPYLPKLELGDIQSMVYKADNIGRFWMTPAWREQRQHDKVLEGQTITQQ